jgi:hypothetical protein
MELGGHDGDVVHDDDSHPHIGRQMCEQADIGIEATGRAAHANDRKVFCKRILSDRQASPPSHVHRTTNLCRLTE